jgi:hypothetical protein
MVMADAESSLLAMALGKFNLPADERLRVLLLIDILSVESTRL